MNKEEKTRALPSRWSHWGVGLSNPEGQIGIIESSKRLGYDTKSGLVQKIILGGDFRVLTVDGSMMEYTTKLVDFIFTVNEIGALYDQAVKAMNKYHSEAKVEQLLNNVDNQQMEPTDKLLEVINLTKGLRDGCKSDVP